MLQVGDSACTLQYCTSPNVGRSLQNFSLSIASSFFHSVISFFSHWVKRSVTFQVHQRLQLMQHSLCFTHFLQCVVLLLIQLFRPLARTITLHKDENGILGFTHKNNLITAIIKDSSASRNGLIINQRIIEVDGRCVMAYNVSHMCCQIWPKKPIGLKIQVEFLG